VYAAGQVSPGPQILSTTAPVYPERLRATGKEGRVLVRAIVDTLGHVEAGSLLIVDSPDSGFDGAAATAVAATAFLPGMVHGRPVRTLVTLPIQFRLAQDSVIPPLQLVNVEEPPVLTTSPAPVYPASLAQGPDTATVVVAFVVDTLGKPEPNSFSIEWSPDPNFSREAIRVIRGSRFQPARLQGKAVRVILELPVRFRRE